VTRALTHIGAFLAGALAMLAGPMIVAARLAQDTHTDPRPGRDS
jgi:hypothetical protein